MGLFAELQRRNVFRAALAYLVATWVVLQISQLVLEAIEAPTWVIKVFLLVFALGLPLTLLFSWAYEITPEGIKREKDVDRSQSVTRETGKKLDQVTIALVVALLLFVAADRIFFDSAVQTTPETSPVSTVDAEKSIAVLAFEDLSPGGDQDVFADGLPRANRSRRAAPPCRDSVAEQSAFHPLDQVEGHDQFVCDKPQCRFIQPTGHQQLVHELSRM